MMFLVGEEIDDLAGRRFLSSKKYNSIVESAIRGCVYTHIHTDYIRDTLISFNVLRCGITVDRLEELKKQFKAAWGILKFVQ